MKDLALQEGVFMQLKKALVVEDESGVRLALFRSLEKKSFSVNTATTSAEAQIFLKQNRAFDIAILDLQLPDGSGLDLLKMIKTSQPHCTVIVLTGHASINSAIEATKAGAFHFLTKPFNVEELLNIIDRSQDLTRLEEQNVQLKSELNRKFSHEGILGKSVEIKSVLNLIERVADTDSTILVTGESGTGKELIAKAIHANSSRRDQPFIPVNCGAIPSELLESEFFGHVKGAFTGAIQNRVGRFELADGGTIFLDEIGDLEPALQVKILRVLQEKVFEPVGGTKSISVNVRVIAATNRNLDQMVEQGKFREDLFYRLNVIPLHIPPLRERKSDIPLLIEFFTQKFNKIKGRKLEGFTSQAMESLVQYPWPGNIRELENLVERISILKGQGLVEVPDLPTKYQGTGTPNLQTIANSESRAAVSEDLIFNDGMDFNAVVDQFENQLIMKALEKTGWNRNQAAILLKLNRTTLVEKMKKKGLKSPGEETQV